MIFQGDLKSCVASKKDTVEDFEWLRWNCGWRITNDTTNAFELLGFDSDNGSEFLNHHLRDHFALRKKQG